jgi:hypothetical protein
MLNRISKNLQDNPMIVVFMFVISVLSALLTIILGWKDFYNDYLSKTITIPIWLLILVAIVSLVAWFIFKPSTIKAPTEFEEVEGKKFGVQQVILDGRTFKRCEFDGAELIFNGENGFNLESNHFKAPKFTFGNSASNTIAALTSMYKDPAFRPLVELTLTNIKSGVILQSTPVSKIA